MTLTQKQMDRLEIVADKQYIEWAKPRIAQLESALRASARRMELAGLSHHEIDALLGSAAETDCRHGQIVQTGCPACEKRLGRVGVEIGEYEETKDDSGR